MEELRHHMGNLNRNTGSRITRSTIYSTRFEGVVNDEFARAGATLEERMKMLKSETTKMTSV
jgi:hypothetical protein